jgi:hypothetical protein
MEHITFEQQLQLENGQKGTCQNKNQLTARI